MQASMLVKFGFRIHTRAGGLVENIVIAGRDEADAVRKLRQMYRECEIIECEPLKEKSRLTGANFEDVAGLISDSTG